MLLFLYAQTGAGHRASARAVAEAVAERHGAAFAVRLVDPFAELAPRLLHRAVRSYDGLIRHAPWAWGLGYHATDSHAALRLLDRGPLRLLQPGLEAAVGALRPAAVVSFHPLLNHVTARVLEAMGEGRPPLVTVVTDLVDVHAAWTCPAADAVVTASPGGLDRCRRAGIPAERCFDLGLPVRGGFRAPATRRERRLALGLDPDRFTVLLTGGGAGTGGLGRRARALVRAGLDVQVAVVCGRNRRLREALGPLAARGIEGRRTPVRVAGFVEDMPDWMGAADVVVTKAGPGTIAEALCSGTPLLLTSYLPGQEHGNVACVVDVGAGRWVPGLDELVDAVRELSTPGSPALAAMRDALPRAARPESSARIADLVCRLAAAAAPPRAPRAAPPRERRP